MMSEQVGNCVVALTLGVLFASAGCGQAVSSDSPAAGVPANSNSEPATVAQAAKVLDLRDLALVAGSDAPGGRTVARLVYQAKGSPKEAFAFHRKQLVDDGWQPAPNETVTDESAAGMFTRDGYALSLSASSSGGDKPTTMVTASNHGNLGLKTLPKPGNSEVLYEFPVSLAYVTPDGVQAVADDVEAKLLAEGWEPYGTAGDTRFYRKNAIRLLATTSAAPAQDGKTVVTYFTELLSAELPAPRDAKRMQYSEPPVQLSIDFAGDLAAADKWYREQLGKMGWEPTTENPVKEGFEYFVIYRNKAGEMLEITLQEVDDFTRLQLEYTTAEEFAEMEKRWEEQRKKAEASK